MKTTHETRLELLNFAKDFLVAGYYAKRDNITFASGDIPPSVKELNAIPYPTDTNITDLARTLINFVEKK